MSRVSALVFDVDDTLYDLAQPYREAYAEVFAPRLDLPVEELFVLSRQKSDEALELLTAGKISEEDHKVLRVQWTLGAFGVEVSRTDALAFQAAYAQAQTAIQPYPQAVEMLECASHAGLPLGIISNGDERHQLRKLALLGVDRYVDPSNVVVSGAYGQNKPATALFRAMEERLGQSGKGVWYFGDTYETDVVGAKRAGWSCVWLDVRGRAVPELPERPDVVVRSVDELRDVVRALVEG